MNNFFDLKEFLARILRKSKAFVVVIVLCVGIMLCYRMLPLINAYLADSDEIISSNNVEIPSVYESTVTYMIENDVINEDDETGKKNEIRLNNILSLFRLLQKDEAVLAPTRTQYFKETRNTWLETRKHLVEIGYIYSSDLVKDYTTTDFSNGLFVTTDNQFVVFHATAFTTELANNMLNSYINSLQSKVNGILSHNFLEVSSSTFQNAVQPVTGSPRTNFGSAIIKPTPKELVVAAVKACIWGVGMGLCVAVIFIFFVSIIDRRLVSFQQLEELHLEVLGMVSQKRKKHFLYFLDRWADKLEGLADYELDINECSRLAFVKMQLKLKSLEQPCSKVVLTSTLPEDRVRQFIPDILNNGKTMGFEIVYAGNISKAAEALLFAQNCDAIIALEEIHKSNITFIASEIETSVSINKKIIGCILI